MIRTAELNEMSLEERFGILIDGLNAYCYDSLGTITKLDNRTLNLYKKGSCQIINLHYSTGILTITWKFKYFQQEMIYTKNLPYNRDITPMWQLKMLEIIISEFLEKYTQHERNVLESGIVSQQLSEIGLNEKDYLKAKKILEKYQ